jgi:hypothetical protein
MKRYFKCEVDDANLGKGVTYIEFEDEWPTRQVEIYGGRWYSSLEDYHPDLGPGLADQPLSTMGLGSEDEISASEFEQVWLEAVRKHEQESGSEPK